MARGPTHLVDPDTIEVGDVVHFECPSEDCTYHFWKHWQPGDAVNRFGDPRDWSHDPPVYMNITAIKKESQVARRRRASRPR